MTAMAAIVICAVLFAGGRGLAAGSVGDVLRVRFGGDGERTRVVIDLGASAQGRVVEEGTAGQVVLTLTGVAPRADITGDGSGLVNTYAVNPVGTASRVELRLSRAAQIERRFLLPPGDGVASYRYVIDLKATGPARAVANGARPVASRSAAPRR
ncbi:MAG TPA: N-acetylmuramoyl-L-alanine amidase, partial [Brevundimonas sp.]